MPRLRTHAFNTSFMRVCQPGPPSLKARTTSASRRTFRCSLGAADRGRPRGLSISAAIASPTMAGKTSCAGRARRKSSSAHTRAPAAQGSTCAVDPGTYGNSEQPEHMPCPISVSCRTLGLMADVLERTDAARRAQPVCRRGHGPTPGSANPSKRPATPGLQNPDRALDVPIRLWPRTCFAIISPDRLDDGAAPETGTGLRKANLREVRRYEQAIRQAHFHADRQREPRVDERNVRSDGRH